MTDFESWWPVAESRLQAMLRGMRVHRDYIEEVTQETATRAYEREFENERHLVAWSVVVARRIVYNENRRKARQAAAYSRHVAPTQDSVEDVVTALLKRDSLSEVIRRLPAHRRAALESATSDDPREAGRLAVARHRARMELRRIYERLGVVVGTWRLRVAAGLGLKPQDVGEAGNATAAVLGAAFALLGAAAVLTGALASPPAVSAPHEASTPPRVVVGQAVPSPQSAVTEVVNSSAPRGRGAESQPDLRIDLGTDSAGRERNAQWRSPEPEEDGALYCSGEPDDPDYKCVKWPAVVLELGRLLNP